MNKIIIEKVSKALNIQEKYVEAVMIMIEEGSTIPFIARYRKEKTNNLDEDQLRSITMKYDYEDKLFTRKNEVINSIEEKGKLTDELRVSIENSTTLKEVEDLYLPYKEKKKTRASVAISKGLEPLANWILEGHDEEVEEIAKKYITDDVLSIEEALQGASDIIAEQISDNKDYRDYLRKNINRFGIIKSKIKKGAIDEKKIFEMYYDHQEPVKWIANHRILAINRGENEGILSVNIETNNDDVTLFLRRKLIRKNGISSNKIIINAIDDSYDRLLFPSIERETRNELSEKAGDGAIELFKTNLEQLLLTPPLKNRWMIGLDPAFRTGCKLAVINGNGDFIIKDVIYPHQKFPGENVPASRIQEAENKLANLVKTYGVKLIAIGNGTASRESQEFVVNTIKKFSLNCEYVIVSEAGASVYSASELAKKEFPNLVVEERSAISIARRVIDPLAELIKIEPKSIGVGQYQHDVNQKQLEEGLDFTITKVVNSVGVNINSASSALLQYVSGLTKKSAESIIDYRKEFGSFKNREEIKKVKGIGAKSYEQCIGFLKILESDQPLDKTFIHPDEYAKVIKMLKDLNINPKNIGSEDTQNILSNLNTKQLSEKYDIGEFTFVDIINELSKPLRDIRDDYPTPVLRNDILHIEDLKPGMKLQGTVRSIVDFGAFVDIGLKNDGMIHKSKMSTNKISHPMEVLNIGDIIDVYILEVNLEKGKVALSLLPQ